MVAIQKTGAYAALFQALAYTLGFIGMATFLNPGDTTGWDGARRLAFVLEHKSGFLAWYLLVYLAFAPALVAQAVALHERFKARTELMKLATPFALIWAGLIFASGMVTIYGLEAVARLHSQDGAMAVAVWKSVSIVADATGGGIELVGGIWVLLISLASLRARLLPRALDYLGLFVGVCGILTVLPALKDLTAVFGLSQILWYVGMGLAMLRKPSVPASRVEAAAY